MKPEQNKLKLVQVLLVYYCNLACGYCYQDFSKVEVKKMSLKTFKSIVEKFKDEKNLDLNLFGGEPLLNKEIIDYVTGENFIIPNNITTISLNTNGVFLDKKVRDFAQRNKKKVCIDLSIDGNKEIHDFYRKDL